MEVYNRLPQDLQWYTEKMWFTSRVLGDLKGPGRVLYRELQGICSLVVTTTDTVYCVHVEDNQIILHEFRDDTEDLTFRDPLEVVQYVTGTGTVTRITKGFTRVF